MHPSCVHQPDPGVRPVRQAPVEVRRARIEAVEAAEELPVALVQRKASPSRLSGLSTPPRTLRADDQKWRNAQKDLSTPEPVSRIEVRFGKADEKPEVQTMSCEQVKQMEMEVEAREEELLADLNQELDSLEQSLELSFPQQLKEMDEAFSEMQELRSASNSMLSGASEELWAKSASAVQASHWVAAGAEAAAKTFRSLTRLEGPNEVPFIEEEAPLSPSPLGDPVCRLQGLSQEEEALMAVVQTRISEVTRSFSGQSGWPGRLHATVELKLMEEVRAVQERLAQARRQRQRRQKLLLEAARTLLEDLGRGFEPQDHSPSSEGSTETLLVGPS